MNQNEKGRNENAQNEDESRMEKNYRYFGLEKKVEKTTNIFVDT